MRHTAVFLLLLLLVVPALADEKQPASKPGKPLTAEQAADTVLAAMAAKESFKPLAERDKPDPWWVAEELAGRGEHDAAEAFAKAAPRPATKALPAYVQRLRGRDDADARAALREIEAAQRANDMQAAMRAIARVKGANDTITRLRIAVTSGAILNFTNRRAEAVKAYERYAQDARKLGWLTGAYHFLTTGGDWATEDGLLAPAKTLKEGALEVAVALGGAGRIAKAHSDVGLSYGALGDAARALHHQREALERFRRIKHRRGEGLALGRLGILHKQQGDFAAAGTYFQQALEIHRERKDAFAFATAIGNLAVVAEATGRYDEALARYEESLAIFRKLPDPQGVMRTLGNLGSLRNQTGEPEKALGHFREVLAFYARRKNKPRQSDILANMAIVLSNQGKFAAATAHSERAMKLARETNYKPTLLHAIRTAAAIQRSLGNWEKALEHQRAALALAREIGDRRAAIWLLNSIGTTHLRRSEHQEAKARFVDALAAAREGGDPPAEARALIGLGDAAAALGEIENATAHLQDALRVARGSNDSRLQSLALNRLSNAFYLRRDLDEAVRLLEEARDLPGVASTPLESSALGGLARMRLEQGRAHEAVSLARQAIGKVLVQTEHLSETEGSSARDFFSFAFDAGQEAAVKLGDPATLLWFMEQSRAVSLRESFASQESLQSVVLPPELRKSLARATLGQRSALDAYRRAQRGNLKQLREARTRLDEAVGRVEELSARIQREAKAAASLTLPKPDDLASVQERLGAAEALVVYGLTRRRCFALVLRARKARIVDLGTSGDVARVLGDLLVDEAPHVEPAGVPAVRARIVDPLALGEDVQTVMVCPAGRLGYVPFTLLLPGRHVSYLPSGTTYGLLRERAPGQGGGVLALGDPDYRASVTRLAPLPATRKEVQAIGDVVVLGDKATIPGFTKALAGRKRWRAVHFACHGLVDPEHPMRSSIALTPSPGDDGHLRCLDVLRLRVPADLVTLSACETARGKVYETEGIVGLTRAFMFAGAPRVLGSLWKVDDEATQALMIRFYELWNPKPRSPSERDRSKEKAEGRGAATALKEAQAFVRSHEEWKHPRYWAAWVLWGLPN